MCGGWCLLMWVSVHDTCESMHKAATGQPQVLFLECHHLVSETGSLTGLWFVKYVRLDS